MVQDLFRTNQIDHLAQHGDTLFGASLGTEHLARESAPVRHGRSEVKSGLFAIHASQIQRRSVSEVFEGG